MANEYVLLQEAFLLLLSPVVMIQMAMFMSATVIIIILFSVRPVPPTEVIIVNHEDGSE